MQAIQVRSSALFPRIEVNVQHYTVPHLRGSRDASTRKRFPDAMISSLIVAIGPQGE